MSKTDLLAEYQVPGQPGLYVIGSFDRKTSLYFQQMRALNLIWLLESAGKLAHRPRICILGGGIAGVTAAAALAARGQTGVTLLEKGPELLALQAHSQRPIHPHIYSWPAAGAENPRAELPLLDWQAGTSADIAAGWARAFAALRQQTAIDVQLEAPATALERAEPGFRVAWQQTGQNLSRDFDLVILALGVGIERTVIGLPLHSYWENDALLENAGEVLVSGCGEGGMLELLRLRLAAFKPEALMAGLAQNTELKHKLLSWEAAAPEQPDSAVYLTQNYASLDLPALDRQLEALLIPNLKVSLHGPHPSSPLNLQATILNRLLVSRLLKMGDLSYFGGMKLLAAKPQDAAWLACFGNGSEKRFDAILVRHGASSAVKNQFASLWEQAMEQGQIGTSPRLLAPLWPEGFYAAD